MIGLMLYWLVMGTLLTLAAEALHRAAGAGRMPSRFIWVGALTASLLGPLLVRLLPRPLATIPVALQPIDYTMALNALVGEQAKVPVISLDLILLLAWVFTSTVLLIYGSVAMLKLRRARLEWTVSRRGEDVMLVSDDMGPAVVGILEPAIVVPRWFDGLSQSEQRVILDHEQEHIAAEDPILILWSQLIPALMPWNPAVWLQARRLREAVELDCDSRVLALGTNAGKYAQLLLDVGDRTVRRGFAVATLSEPRSLLEKRIRRLCERPRFGRTRAVCWAFIGFGAAASAAGMSPTPTGSLVPALVIPFVPETKGPIVTQPVPVEQDTGRIGARLKNRAEITRITKRFYPPLLEQAGIGGTAIVSVRVGPSGGILDVRLRESTGHAPLDDAALKIARSMRFTPARSGGKDVTSWAETAVIFEPNPDSYKLEAREQGYQLLPNNEVIDRAPVFTPFTVAPKLQNQAEVVQGMQRYYPPLLRDAGIGGTIKIWFLIDENGDVAKVQLKEGSGHEALDDAAMKVAQLMRFSPALNRDQTVKVWVDMPIVFKTQ